ncbi:MAG: hypothetical protein ACTH1D_03485 [Mycobacteriaceae bacterium]|uniref:hypothetical protein n=1 Tax=Corynebacterium sp. TaxID=1720 RepID=UPI003F97C780
MPQQAPMMPTGYEAGPPAKEKNTLGLVAMVIAIIGFVFACIPGALIIGWVLLPIAFLLSLVSLFQRGKKQGFGFAGLIISIVGVLVGVFVFFTVVDDAIDDAFSGSDVSVSDNGGGGDGEGSRSDPFPLGSTVSDDDWSVTINSVDLDAADAVAGANQFNQPAPEGMTYILVNATVAYIGDSDDGEMTWATIEYVTADGNSISSSDGDTLAVAPDSLDTLSDVYQGGETSGNVVLTVPADSAAEGVLAVSPGMMSDNAFVSVQ